MASFINIIFSGTAFGVVLFLMAGGLSVTMGLMGFANLAHAALAMLGGYLAVTLMNQFGMPFFVSVIGATIGTAIFALILERVLLRYFYAAAELRQVLLSIGLMFMSIAAAIFVFGPAQQPIHVPAYLEGPLRIGSYDFDRYRLFLIVVGLAVTAIVILGIEQTRFGARVRAAVDSRRMTASCGVDVDRLFMVAFAIGGALAGLGGALSINLLGLDPNFALRYLMYMLIVVIVGGLGSMKGTFLAAIALGASDVAGRYYAPDLSAFLVYALAVAIILVRPRGFFGRR